MGQFGRGLALDGVSDQADGPDVVKSAAIVMYRGGKLVVVWTLGVISECYFYCLMPKSGAKKEEKEEEGRFIFSTSYLVLTLFYSA